jgi:hypothetical protein
MRSYGGDDDAEGDDSLDGVLYGDPETMGDKRSNDKTPRTRRQAPSGDDTIDDFEPTSQFPITHPPIQGRLPGGIASGTFSPRSELNPSALGAGIPMHKIR